MSALAMGESFGRVPRRWSAGNSAALSVVVHDHQRVNGMHAHEAAFVALMLDGQYRETAGARSVQFDRFTAVYHPSEVEHQDVIGGSGVQLLMFEFRAEVFDGVAIDRTRFRSLRDISGSVAAWELLRLYREAVVDDEPLQFESRALALLANVAPLARTRRDLPSVERAREYLHAHFRDRVMMSDVASAAGVHPVHLGQAFHREYGETVGNYVTRLRIRSAAEQLTTTGQPLAAIALDHGFCDQSHLQRAFKRLSGFTPAQFRRAF